MNSKHKKSQSNNKTQHFRNTFISPIYSQIRTNIRSTESIRTISSTETSSDHQKYLQINRNTCFTSIQCTISLKSTKIIIILDNVVDNLVRCHFLKSCLYPALKKSSWDLWPYNSLSFRSPRRPNLMPRRPSRGFRVRVQGLQ